MYQRCQSCKFSECAYQQVNTVGDLEECELLIVGDYPRQEDDVTGYPFSGSDYDFLWQLLNQVSVKYCCTYLMRCIPIDKNTRRYYKPEYTEYDVCYYMRFIKDVERLKPKCILALGQSALDIIVHHSEQILNVTKSVSISDYRERAHDIIVGTWKTKLIGTYSALYALKAENDQFYNRFIGDVVYACRHAMIDRKVYRSKTISPQQFSRIVDIWCNDERVQYIGYDTESNGLNPWVEGSKITSFSVSADGVIGYNIFLYHPELDITDQDREMIISSAKKLLTTKKIVSHHAKHEHRFCKVCWGFTPNITEDTMYMAYILYMGYPGMSYGLKYLSGRFVQLPPWEETMDGYVSLFKAMKRVKSIDDARIDKWQLEFNYVDFTDEEAYKWFNILRDPDYYIRQAESASSDPFMWMVPTRVMEKYAGMDAIAPLQLMRVLKPIINKDKGLLNAYNLLVEAAEVFANIELKGLRLQDRNTWIDIYQDHLKTSLDKLRKYPEVKELEEDLGTEFNPGSSQQVQKLLFEYFHFPVKATTAKGAPSTGEPVIVQLIEEFQRLDDEESKRRTEFLLTYREYKKLGKMLSAYFQGLSRFAHMNDSFDGHECKFLPVPIGENDEMIHPGYMLHGTVTGRLSSQDPSVHTFPYRSDVKKMVVPFGHKRGSVFIASDQSQLEIRVLACVIEKYYGDSSLAQAYRDGRDIHRFNASKIFLKPEEEILDAERRFAKTISFALLYGSSERSVAEDTGRTADEVHQLFEQFYDSFPGIRLYIADTHKYVSKYGCVRTPLGRLKYLLGALNPNDHRKYADSLRQAQNSIIQSSGSDLSLRSIVYMDHYFREHNMGSQVVSFVHDSITVDTPAGEWFESMDLLKYAMKYYNEELDWVTCPLQIDVDISDNYGDHAAIKKFEDHEDGSRTLYLEGYDYVINNILEEAKVGYDILEDELLEEHEFFETDGDSIIVRKSINLSFTDHTFNEQSRKIRLRRKVS